LNIFKKSSLKIARFLETPLLGAIKKPGGLPGFTFVKAV